MDVSFFKAGKKISAVTQTKQTSKVLLVKTGLLMSDLESNRLFAAMDHGIWLPADTPLRLRVSRDCSGWLVRPSQRLSAALPATAYSFKYSPLLRELADRMSGWGASKEAESQNHLICELFIEELRATPHAQCLLPWPGVSLLVVTKALERSNGSVSLAELCSVAEMSKRTLTRRFRAETGLSIGEWRQRFRIWKAMKLLSQGRSVIATAIELGFESPSAFAKSFRSSVGRSPTEYVRTPKSGDA